MADRSKHTLESLRKLAREHLGAGYSRLSKAELLAALRKVVPGLLGRADTGARARPAERSAMKKEEAEAEPGRPGRAKRVSLSDVQSQTEQQRTATLKKKPEEAPPRKGAPPVTARVTAASKPAGKAAGEKAPSRGMARVKSAITTLAKEVEARRLAAKEADAQAPKAKKPAPKAEIPAVKAPAPQPEKPKAQPKPAEVAEVKAPAPQPEKPKAQPKPAQAAEVKAPVPQPEEPKSQPKPAAEPAEVAAPKPAPAPAVPPPAAEAWTHGGAVVTSRPVSEARPVAARATLEAAPAAIAARVRTTPERAGRPVLTRGRAAEPVVEGFFVARMVGPDEARRHHLTDEFHAAAPQAPALPGPYSGGRIFTLARDPSTLFVFWDARAAGLRLENGERIIVRILQGDDRVRELDADAVARGYYVEGLAPDATYRAEAWAVGTQGERPLGITSVPVVLPGVGRSADRVRFLRVPWSLPLPRLREFLRAGSSRFSERPGLVVVPTVVGTWREEGAATWSPGVSGRGRWVRQGQMVAFERAEEWEQRGGEEVPSGAPTVSGAGLSGAGRPSSFSWSRDGRRR